MSITTSGGLSIEDAQVIGGFFSAIYVKINQTREGILFDCGILLPNSVSARWVFISHGHVDHVGAAVSHARARALSHQPAIYYVPEGIQNELEVARQAFSAMDKKDIPMDIRVIQPGEAVAVGSRGQYSVRAFATTHRVHSVGYAVFSTTVLQRAALREEYQQLSPAEVRAMVRQGVQVKNPAVTEQNLDFVYTGDTTFDGLLTPENVFVFKAELLVLECTYLDGLLEKANEYQHVHIQSILDHMDLFENKQIVLTHLSGRYKPHYRALKLLSDLDLPAGFARRLLVTLEAFGAPECLSRVVRLHEDRREVGQSGKSSIRSGGMDDAPARKNRRGSPPCKFFFSDKGCLLGGRCKFSHEG
eukprot:GSChrysophyteH1.ASY1.ANO1.687.1 assembled CDS